MSAPNIAAEGVTNPSIDDLLTKTDSKYKLVLYSAKRARQINAYYSQLGEGLLEYVGPLVDTLRPGEAALDRAPRDQRRPPDLRGRRPRRLAAEAAAAEAARAGRRSSRSDVTSPDTPVHASLDDVAVSRTGERPRVVLGVGGGIAAYKACELLRRFTESGHDVTVVPTAAALEFVGAPTWAALSGKPVSTEVWTDVHEVPHVRIGQTADLVVVAPATADLMARAAHGLADDLLTNTLLTARCPVVLAPAMHTEMWEHPATAANVATLRTARRGRHRARRGPAHRQGHRQGPPARARPRSSSSRVEVLGPGCRRARPRRAGAWSSVPAAPASTSTRSASSATAPRASRATPSPGRPPRAAPTSPWSAPTSSLPDPAGVSVVRVETTAQLRDAVVPRPATADAVVMAAAPADFRPTSVSEAKIKKADDGSAPAIGLEQNPDILAEISHDRARPGAVVVGFAAETGDAHRRRCSTWRRAKLARKGCDLLVVNDVSGGAVFGSTDNEAVILAADGAVDRGAPRHQDAPSPTSSGTRSSGRFAG